MWTTATFHTSLVFLLATLYCVVAEKTEKNQVVTITDDNHEQVFTGEWMLELYVVVGQLDCATRALCPMPIDYLPLILTFDTISVDVTHSATQLCPLVPSLSAIHCNMGVIC